ncbi:hypothetical protein SISSUDRAFT_1040111 [Sistotremastrum suecicum HHB10207 ss-3]|uniref:Uncharacterized protein n=1 Tax=Sistotremastrum suecicum HHB10207 ss-3 TaxID=1314776 RepID=A0A166IDB6_9AGAM|nr:hypothetical protein SISSUDRAFT_1040111 [Sistotremastrum suecicum HHB10207 ss-3]
MGKLRTSKNSPVETGFSMVERSDLLKPLNEGALVVQPRWIRRSPPNDAQSRSPSAFSVIPVAQEEPKVN